MKASKKSHPVISPEANFGPFLRLLRKLEGEKIIIGVFAVAEPLRIPQTPKKRKKLCENRVRQIRAIRKVGERP